MWSGGKAKGSQARDDEKEAAAGRREGWTVRAVKRESWDCRAAGRDFLM